MTRAYGQYCGVAHALDLIGGRWSLLIIRDLMTGPKRFSELEQGLHGIPTNILSSRLRELEEAGIVERKLLPRPATSVVYELTPYGLELDEPMKLLGMWGAKSLGRPQQDDFYSGSALMMALRARFRPEAAVGQDLQVEIRLDDQLMNVSVSNGEVSFSNEPFADPHLTLETSPNILAEIFAGYETFDSALAAGRIQIDGPQDEARRFFDIFYRPVREEDVG
jgi:DNA-binding HxlR family transcriptional regulator/putative sterol carrier protein